MMKGLNPQKGGIMTGMKGMPAEGGMQRIGMKGMDMMKGAGKGKVNHPVGWQALQARPVSMMKGGGMMKGKISPMKGMAAPVTIVIHPWAAHY